MRERAPGGQDTSYTVAQLHPARELADVDDSEIGEALHELWGGAAPWTWNRNGAAVGSWLVVALETIAVAREVSIARRIPSTNQAHTTSASSAHAIRAAHRASSPSGIRRP